MHYLHLAGHMHVKCELWDLFDTWNKSWHESHWHCIVKCTFFAYMFLFHRICHGGVESMNERVQDSRSPPVNLSLNTDSHSTEVKRDSFSSLQAEGGVVATVKSEVYSNQQQERQPYHHVPFHHGAHSSYGKDEQRSMPDSTFEDSYNGENVVRVCFRIPTPT